MKFSKFSAFSLIEILISLMIFSISILALAKMQWAGAQINRSAMYRSIATIQIENMIEKILANNHKSSSQDISDWNQENAKSLPSGNGSVLAYNNEFRIVLHWLEPQLIHDQSTSCPNGVCTVESTMHS